MRTKRPHGTGCTAPSKCAGSITKRRISLDGACTNWAEEYFSRLRRAEAGHYHHVAGNYLLRYAQESSCREDHRRVSNGDQTHRLAGLAMRKRTSPDFVGYWQRRAVA